MTISPEPRARAAGAMMLHRFAISILAGLVLAACADRPAEPPPGSVRVGPGVVLVLPKPAELGRTVEATQLITAHYGEQTFVFEAHLSATPERLLLVGLDPMGRKMVSVTWSDVGIRIEAAPGLPRQLHPENMLADIVMLYWPEDSVRRALADSGARLTVGPHSRSVTALGAEVIHADFDSDDPWSGTLKYRNIPWGYGLEVKSVEVSR